MGRDPCASRSWQLKEAKKCWPRTYGRYYSAAPWVLVRLTYRKIEKSRQRLRENDDDVHDHGSVARMWAPKTGLEHCRGIGKGLLLRFAKTGKRYFDNENKYGRTWLVRYFQIVIFLLVEEVLVCWWSSSSADFFVAVMFLIHLLRFFPFSEMCFFRVAPELTSLEPASMSSWEGNHMSFFHSYFVKLTSPSIYVPQTTPRLMSVCLCASSIEPWLYYCNFLNCRFEPL